MCKHDTQLCVVVVHVTVLNTVCVFLVVSQYVCVCVCVDGVGRGEASRRQNDIVMLSTVDPEPLQCHQSYDMLHL